MAPAHRRRRLSLALLGLVGVGVAVIGLGPSKAPPPGQRAERARPAAPPPVASPEAAEAEPPPARPARRSSPNQPPRLSSALLDRTRLCPGESTLLRMTAEDPDDDDLRFQATLVSPALGGPRFGFGRWLRIEAPERAGRYGVLAVVEDRARARDELPLELVVEPCDTSPPFDASQLLMRHAELDASTHEFDLASAAARAREAGKSLEVVRWHFGDGATQSGGLRAGTSIRSCCSGGTRIIWCAPR